MRQRIDQETKRKAHERARGFCERCGRRFNRRNWEAHVHHLTYARVGSERPEDVEVLCLGCHGHVHGQVFHDRQEQTRRRRKRARKRRRRLGLTKKKIASCAVRLRVETQREREQRERIRKPRRIRGDIPSGQWLKLTKVER